MNTLDVTESKAKKMDEAEDNALSIVNEVMSGNRDVDDTARMAMKVLGVAAKNRQTLTAREGMRFNMAAQISSEKQLRKYVAVTTPQVHKALTGKSR